MARPVEIDDARLLKIARELFLEKGAAATTGEVARRAGIAQGSIFRRYKSKADLFRAAMLSESFPWMGSLRERTEAQGLKAALIDTAPEIVALYRKVLPAAMMSWSHRRMLGARGEIGEIPTAVRNLFAFFAEQMDAGRLRRADPQAVAGAFVAPLFAYTFGEVMGRKINRPFPEFIADHINLLWDGIAPERRKK